MTAVFAAAALLASSAALAQGAASAEYPEFYDGNSSAGIDFVQSVRVLAPRPCSNVKGDVTVVFEAKGMTRALARCWRQDGGKVDWVRVYCGKPVPEGFGEIP